MKKRNLIIACSLVAAALTACNGNSETSTTDNKSTDTGTNTAATPPPSTPPADQPTTPPAASKPALTGQDSVFVMKAAVGGMMEVQSSEVALQNGANDRVKAYATMMVADHTKANNELKGYAAEHGMMLPAALPADKQKHIDDMKAMTGKAFDKHYVGMMLNDHKTTVSDFEKQVNTGKEEDLKGWASKTLPTLKMHRDSVMALSKMKM